jgi:16S rRNA (cytosine1402-N4)-methyltransferase
MNSYNSKIQEEGSKSDTKKYHISVMLEESLQHLNVQPDGTYIDGTLGEGGHSYEIFKKLSPKGTLLSIDQDKNAITFTEDFFKDAFESISANPNDNAKWLLRNANFSHMSRFTKELDLKPNGILLDLGLSSRQLEQSGNNRGFSYQEEQSDLDMRMDQGLAVKAKDVLKALNEHELVKLLRLYGEERHARQIAKSIKMALNKGTSIETVGDLNEVIRRAVPAAFRQKGKHPSRRVFQALRIAVNDELNSLKETLKQAIEILEPKGRLVIISFHSLEDRITKEFMRNSQTQGLGSIIKTDSLTATEEELSKNPRARSAKFRVFEKA